MVPPPPSDPSAPRLAWGLMTLSFLLSSLAHLAYQVVKVKPHDKDAKMKYQECNKIVKQKAFERAIAGDEHKRSVVDSLDIESMSESGPGAPLCPSQSLPRPCPGPVLLWVLGTSGPCAPTLSVLLETLPSSLGAGGPGCGRASLPYPSCSCTTRHGPDLSLGPLGTQRHLSFIPRVIIGSLLGATIVGTGDTAVTRTAPTPWSGCPSGERGRIVSSRVKC